jgi:geranylgeranylglycerol-phosphate geranylgeranyltransferase
MPHWREGLELLRPGNAAMAAAGTATGILLAGPGAVDWEVWLAAPLSAALVAGFGNTLNDVRDIELDRTAHPGRPLPSGRIDLNEAKDAAMVLLFVGLLLAYLAAGWPTLALAAGNAALLWLYEAFLKRRGAWGNAAIAALVASTFLYGAVARGLPEAPLVWLLAVLAFLVNLARELLKDVEDMAADAGRRRTLPMQVGVRATVAMAAFETLAAVVLLGGGWFWLQQWPLALQVALGVACAVLLAGAGLAFRSAATGQRTLKAGMALALAAFIGGGLVGRL